MLSPLTNAKEMLDQLIEERDLDGEMSTSFTPTGLKIELSSSSFFGSGSADVRESMVPSLIELSEVLQSLPEGDYQVEVEGHTDNVPINTARFPSNWELSSLRAINVAHIFEDTGIQKDRLSALPTQTPALKRRIQTLMASIFQRIRQRTAGLLFT